MLLFPVTVAQSEEDENEAPNMEGVRWEEAVAFGIQTCWGALASFFQLVVDHLDQLSPLGSTLSETFLNQFSLNMQTTSQEYLRLFMDFETTTQSVDVFLAKKETVRCLVERIFAGHGRFLIQRQVQDLLLDTHGASADTQSVRC